MKLHPNVKLAIAIWSGLTVFTLVMAYVMRPNEQKHFSTPAITVKVEKAGYPEYSAALKDCPIGVGDTGLLGVPIGYSISAVGGGRQAMAYLEVIDRDDRRLVINIFGDAEPLQKLLESTMPTNGDYTEWAAIVVFPKKSAHADHVTLGGIAPVGRFKMKPKAETGGRRVFVYEEWQE